MNVCVFGSQIAPSSDGTYVGGAVSSAVNISRSLHNLTEYEIFVLTTAPVDWDRHQDSIEEEWGKITVLPKAPHHPAPLNGTSFFAKTTLALTKYCINNDIDIIHSHSGYPVLASIPVAVSKILGIPVVHSLYCPIPDERGELRDKLSGPVLSKAILSQTDHVLAMSENVRDSLERAGMNSSITVTPPIVDTNEFHPDLEPPTSIELHDNFNILFVGNLKESKGVEYLIRAFGDLPEDIEGQLILTFDQRDFPDREQRRSKIDQLIGEVDGDVVELGIISDMPNLVANVDVVVTPFTDVRGPSDYPIVVLEAMACQTPVIGTNIGGLPELLDNERGMLVSPKQERELLNCLLKVYKTDTEMMTKKSHQYIKRSFSSRKVTQMVNQIYRQVVR